MAESVRPGMTVDTRQTLQGAGLLVLQRVGHVLAALLFAALVPRLMGPDIYGRYALLGSLAGGLILISGLGLREVIGRYARFWSRVETGLASGGCSVNW